MNEQQIQNYLDFLLEVLQATRDSEGSPQVVYPLLAANQDKLDDNFITVLQTWAKATLAKTEASQKDGIAGLIGNFSNLIGQFPLGNKMANMEICLVGCEISLTVFTRHSHAEFWAKIQNNLGNAYYHRIRDDRAQNLEKAIEAFQLALSVWTKKDFPQQWAMTQYNLGNAYQERIRDDKAQNLEKAIEAYQLALEIRTKKDFPQDWAKTQYNLGLAYGNRICGGRAENLEQAIETYQLALSVYTKNDFPQDWAGTQNNLGNAYFYNTDDRTHATGFLCAGARGAVSTLWSVNDLATSLFSIFYHHQRQAGKNRPQALQLAQQQLRQLTGKEFKKKYRKELEKVLGEKLDQAYEKLQEAQQQRDLHAEDSPEYKEWEKERIKRNDFYNRIGEIKNKGLKEAVNKEHPFAELQYWSGFICAGLR